jgi:hypothetical protein
MEIFLLTCSTVPLLYEDDHILLEELRSLGLKAKPAVWDDTLVNWSNAGACIFRSVWDYHLRYTEFLDWLQGATEKTRFYNSPEMVIWNSHKSYLRQLEEKGIPIVETAWISGSEEIELSELLENRSWEEAIIKPAVSASAFKTQRVSLRDRSSLISGQELVEELSRQGEVMVQPYLWELEMNGEKSLMFIAGKYTHAVIRKAALISGREESAQGEAATATPSELRFAQQVIDSLETVPLYARVDLIADGARGNRLIELELIEPVLFFRHSRHAAQRMAEEILRVTAYV